MPAGGCVCVGKMLHDIIILICFGFDFLCSDSNMKCDSLLCVYDRVNGKMLSLHRIFHRILIHIMVIVKRLIV